MSSSPKCSLNLFIFLCAVLFFQWANAEKCYALAMEGTGSHNSYTAGVLLGIAKYLAKEKRSYDAVSGVSMSALNAFVLSFYKPGDELEAATELYNIWSKLSDHSMYKNWMGGVIEGLLLKQGIYDNSPYFETLKNLAYNRTSLKRKLAITLTDLNSGKLATVYESVGILRMLNYVRAAASSAGFFAPISEGKMLLSDASGMLSVDITAAVERCREKVENDEDIVLDIIMIHKDVIEDKNCTNYKAWDVALRALHLRTKMINLYALDDVLRHFPKITKRYLFYPSTNLPNVPSLPVGFRHDAIEKMLTLGEKDAKKIIADGPEMQDWAKVAEEIRASMTDESGNN